MPALARAPPLDINLIGGAPHERNAAAAGEKTTPPPVARRYRGSRPAAPAPRLAYTAPIWGQTTARAGHGQAGAVRRPYTEPPQKTDFLWGTPRALERRGRAWTDAHAAGRVARPRQGA